MRSRGGKNKTKYLKPIIGCEMYVAQDRLTEHVDKKDTGRHLVVLAKKQNRIQESYKAGIQSLDKRLLLTPRTDKHELAAHREGLIISSACLGGEIPRLLLSGNYEEADRQVKWWHDTFGDDYYLELQRHKATKTNANHQTYELQISIEGKILELAKNMASRS